MDSLFAVLILGLSQGLLLFLLAAGLTLVYSLMGLLNFAHAAFYMLGAYLAYGVAQWVGVWVPSASAFWIALFMAPVLVALIGAIIMVLGLARASRRGHQAELLFTFGLSLVLVEAVQLLWGRTPLQVVVPEALRQTLVFGGSLSLPLHRVLLALAALLTLGLLAWIWHKTPLGWVVRAALHEPAMVRAMGYRLPQIVLGVFCGGVALAGFAGALAGSALVTEPGMAAAVGSLLFVIVVMGGLGSLFGAFAASVLVGVLQAAAVLFDLPLAPWLGSWVGSLRLSQLAPVLPFALLLLVLAIRPQGLAGERA